MIDLIYVLFFLKSDLVWAVKRNLTSKFSRNEDVKKKKEKKKVKVTG